MMTGVVLILVALWAAGAVFTFINVRRAPEGYEDETGFHLAKAPARTSRHFDDVVEAEAEHTFG